MSTETTNIKRRTRRALRWIGGTVGGAMILISLCVVALLIPRVRESLLSFGLVRTRASLPGRIDIGHMAWPSPGTVRLTDVTWIDGDDTLLVAAEIACSVVLRPLVSRDLIIDDVVVREMTIDIPAIARRFPPGDEGASNKTRDRFPRVGSLPGLPSLAIGRLSVSASRIRVSDTRSITGVVFEGGCDFRKGRSPAIQVRRFAARGPEGTWRADSLAMDVDLAKGRMDGEGRGYVSPGQPWYLSVSSSTSDSVLIVFAATDSLEPPDASGLVARATIERRDLMVDSIRVDATIRIPGAAELASLPGLASRVKRLPEFDGVTLIMRGTVQLRPRFLARFACDLGEAPRMKGGHFQVVYDGSAFSIDDATLEFVDMPIDRLRYNAHLPLDVDESASLMIVAEGSGLNVGIAARVDRSTAIDVQLSPIVLESHRLEPTQLVLSTSDLSRIRFSPATGVLTAENVRIEGTAGEFRVNARLDRSFAGTYALSCRWREAPEFLFERLGLSPEQSDSLRARWRSGDRFALHASGSVAGGGAARVTKTSGSFTLPGPETFVSIRGDSTRPRELGPVKGSFVLTTRQATNGNEIKLTADLDSTSWIDSSIVRLRLSNETTHIDTVGVAALGLVAGVRGTIAQAGYNISAHVAVLDSSLARRFVPEAPSARLTATAHVSGTRIQPQVEAVFEASVNDSAFRIPQLTGRLWVDERGPKVSLKAPQGVFATHVTLDSASLDFASADSGKAFLPARVSLAARGRDIGMSVSSLIDTTGGLAFDVSDLSLDITQRDLRSTKPFNVRWNSNGLSVDGLHLTGSLGEIRVDGTVAKEVANLTCDLGIDFPPEPESLNLPEHLWPERLDVHFRATDRKIEANGTLAGFSLAHGRRATLRMTVESHADSLRARVVVADSERSLLDATALLPATVSLYPPSLVIGDGALSVDTSIDGYPLAFYFLRNTFDIPKEEVARVRGKISIGGTTTAPVGYATARMSFPDWPKLSAYELGIEAKVGLLEDKPMEGHLLKRALIALRGDSTSNVVAAVSLNESGREVLFGALGHPVTLSLNPINASTPESGTMNAILKADAFPLDRFNPVLPAGLNVAGSCKIDVVAGGSALDPNVDGTIVASRIEMSVADQVRLEAHGNLGISGTASAPDVRGEITIDSGVIQVPEERRNLHPTTGKALLRPDTTGASAPAAPLPAPPEQPARDAAGTDGGTVDITIRIPSALYVRGRGLDLELSGSLHVEKKHGRPVVLGELRVVRGNLVLLGRSLKLERGTVAFQGGDDINPALDVALSTRVDQTNINILITGTARKPKVTLTSEPYLKESDIMSVLLFGTTFNDLDDSQADHLQSRSTDMMAALGAAELQKNLSGVDVVSYQGSDATRGQSGTFTFGKYLSPDVLVSYVYAIDDPQASSFVSLDYLLKGSLRLNTVYGKRNQTGLGIGWKRDY